MKLTHKKDFEMIIDIPNWPLSSLELESLKYILTNWLFSFFKSERQSIYDSKVLNHESLFFEL